ncbi:MAG TPA: S8 family serine peptidase, partial [Hyphomonadaceae bacterium]|nr:S8 family serine peptidase [Hyphomonadaceae bacterium]
MAGKRFVRWVIAGAAASLFGACDAVNDRLDKFGKLTDEVIRQISGEDTGGADPLTTAPLEARALFGVMQAPVELAPVNLEDAMQAQSFFAVGSVIAMPKEQIIEPVVEPESFDLAAADPSAPSAPAEEAAAAGALNTSEAPPPESAEVAAGAPVVEATPEPLPPPPPAPESGAAAGSGGGAAPRLAVRTAPALKRSTPTELREQAQIAPRVLERAVRDSGVKVTKEAVLAARETSEKHIGVDSKTAQAMGDEIARKAADTAAPIPKALAVRSKLKVDVALNARERAYKRLEQMGLSGVVSPEEGGQMRITIGVKPTQLGLHDVDIETMRTLFAQKKADPAKECAGNVTAAQMQADPVLATECVVKVLQQTGDYAYVEKDYIFSHQMLKKPKTAPGTAGVPNDPLFGLQWHFKANGTAAGQSPGGASFADFWTRTKLTGSKAVTVAVVDTGLQMNHPDIKGSANLAQGYDMVSDPMMGNDGDGRDADPNDPGDKCDPNDPNTTDTFHGTHVAG